MADDQDAAADMPVKTEWVGTYKSENDVFDEQRAFLNTLPQSEKDGRADGLFFSHMESIWGSNDATIQAEDFETIRRISEQGHAYDLCCKYIHDDSIEIGRGSRSGKTNADENEAKIDAYGNDNCQAAHLLSHAEVCHKAFVFISEAAVGRKVDAQPTTKSGRKRKRARVLGSNTNALKRLKILNGVHGKNNTSLKSNQYNKMYLKSQGEVYDTDNPSMLVIPLLPLKQVMDWAMEGHQEPYDILTLTFGPRSRRAAKILETAPQECSDNEVEEARQLLETFVKGVAGSLVENDVFESFRKTELNNTSNLSLIRWKELVQRIKDGSQEMIKVPSRKNPLPANFHFAKARLSKGNSLPDPWLLTLKATINYSAFNKTKLMPACQPWTEDDGAPNTDQGQQDYSKDNIDHAAQLALSKQRGGSCIELFDWDKQ